jgi:putative ABC transport system substrate-binding protein
MRRRDFVTLLGSAAAAWPLAASAQQPTKLPTIGFLGYDVPSVASRWLAAFVQRLRTLGWTAGRDIAIEYQWAEGRVERLAEIATAFVRLKANVIVTYGTPGAEAAKRATSTIPVVFVLVGDPVRTGIVSTLARPGGNVTGLSNQSADLPGKRLDLLRKAAPALRRLAILANTDNASSVVETNEAQSAAHKFGIEVGTFEIRRADDIAPVFDALKGRVDALYIATDALLRIHRYRINALALGAKLPIMSNIRQYAEAGGLMSYGANYDDTFERAADFVDKILRGAKPGDIPVEQPTKFELIINLKTAKALDLVIPTDVLAIADEVIE